ncbi:F0F1-ATPase subunit [Prosthecochloris aestuarii DSM 271]|uniref:F0F1-ATPase subunit n=1 Tax=Prosthecochloris aestuarii (strain DSM 271 / SK 413) TaxID=290512 RepID=B4S796_PROA2|nr:AtpZ/AtpI family protein [Prosthecochloris aestuarii]ACF45933.1 F0F1-ATPase subunit [Prosthecochloris aestuarii DSM 271]
MSDDQKKHILEQGSSFGKEVGAKESRKVRARKEGPANVWSGFAISGLVGWSVVIPTLFGVMLGVWIDSRFPGSYSWTLMLLMAGLLVGCFNVWHWVSRENREMQREDSDDE